MKLIGPRKLDEADMAGAGKRGMGKLHNERSSGEGSGGERFDAVVLPAMDPPVTML